MLTSKGREGNQAPPSCLSSNPPMQNKIYELQIHGEHKGSPNVVTSMLKVFHFDINALLEHVATLYFVTPYVAMIFDFLTNVLLHTFSISTPISEYVVAKRVHKKCLIYFFP